MNLLKQHGKTISIIFILSCLFGQAQTIIKKYPNGQVMSEINYKDSIKHGFSRYYFENGKTDAIIEFDNGNLTGTIKEFYETGFHFREIDTKTFKAKLYTRDSSTFYIGTYNSTKFIRNGIWEEWASKSNFKRFTWTFVDDIKHGPYIAHRLNGTIEASGHYYKGTISDTLKLFDTEGKLIEMQIWKPEADGSKSTEINTIYLTDIKSDGTPEVIDGKIYIWKKGKKEYISDVGE